MEANKLNNLINKKMRDFVFEMYNLEKSDFPVKTKKLQFETYPDAENYCTQLNKKLKSERYWKVSQIGGF
jgi:hypothetical protein